MKHRHSQTRQKMSHIIDEIGTALFGAGAKEVSLRLQKEPEGFHLQVQADYEPAHRAQLETLCRLLQPEIRDPALAETYWELAGCDLDSGEGELSLVGQILDRAEIDLQPGTIEMRLFVSG